MRILIEEHQYDVNDIRPVLYGIDALENVEGRVSVHYVGYYYNTLLNDCVFILPKVLLQDVKDEDGIVREKVFGRYLPEEVLNLNKDNNPLEQQEKDFLYKFAVWIYRAIVVYRNDSRQDSDIVYYMKINQVDKGRRRQSNTYLDILLSLVQFNKDNKQFFFFILKNLHSGFNKINWTHTIGTTTAIVKNGKPIYLNPVNKRKQVNFDEELLVIFYSILNNIGDTYGFPKDLNCQFDLITGNKFESYLNGYGKTRLHQIKYKYFSDKALELWKLCYAFFDESRNLYVGSQQKEYLLVKNFYIVFEAIIDELIGDNPLPDGMDKIQEDGKIVDHIFTADSLIENQDEEQRTPTYYIGDSKYYKIGHELGAESIYKQYTYARNVIQWNLDLFYDEEKPNPMVHLRDDVTEGYNIIPNFFISGKMERDVAYRFDYTFDGIGATDSRRQQHIKKQFPNRLFDRDTMLLFHYDVNFLFVLSLYARNNEAQKSIWKTKMRNKFRDDIRAWLQKSYDFYAMKAKPGVNGETYIKENFKKVVGKVYTPFQENDIFSLALDHTDPEHDNDKLKSELEQFFFVRECPLGRDPKKVLPAVAEVVVEPHDKELALCVMRESNNFDKTIERLKTTGQLGIALQATGATLQLVEGFTKAKYLLVHNKSTRQELFYFDGKGPRLMSGDDCKEMAVTKQGAPIYLVYNIDLSLRPYFGGLLDMTPITSLGEESYSPQLIPITSLINK